MSSVPTGQARSSSYLAKPKGTTKSRQLVAARKAALDIKASKSYEEAKKPLSFLNSVGLQDTLFPVKAKRSSQSVCPDLVSGCGRLISVAAYSKH